MSRLLTTLVLAMLVGSCSVVPAHDIKPTPPFVMAGVQPGDRVEITTKDGQQYELIVTEVSAVSIKSENQAVVIADIDTLTKRSWSIPGHPCGAGEPVGCSVPEVLLILSDDLNEQIDKFRQPCATHDFCYRHGHATYGVERLECDTNFYDDMRETCGEDGVFDLLDYEDRALCELAANRIYEAVRKHGEPAFRTTASTYCEYR